MVRSLIIASALLLTAHSTWAQVESALTLEYKGVQRTYDLYVPDLNGNQPKPLVLDLHGFTENSGVQRLRSGMQAVAMQEQFFTAWPNGVLNAWNAVINEPGTDDVGFLRALVAELSDQYPIDPTRIYVTGFSQGGALTARLACEADDVFAAFAMVAGSIARGNQSECNPTRSVPMLTWRGENDDIVRYEGGMLQLGNNTFNIMSAEEVFNFWRSSNQCGSGVNRENLGNDSFCDEATNCAADTRTRACTVQSNNGISPHIIYDNTASLDLAVDTWNFFKEFSHPNVTTDTFTINPGLNDAWYNPETSGQGFFVNVFAETGVVFLAWFTYDTERPPDSITAVLGEPGHRWLTALGTFSGASATLDVSNTTGGIFDQSPPAPVTSAYGTIELQFDDCASGTISYNLPGPGVQGQVPIRRVVQDNIALCESLSESGIEALR